jgi:protein O-mannosyl-transferase
MVTADKKPGGSLKILVAVALAALALAVYAPIYRAGFIAYDDTGYVTENGHMLAVAQRGMTWDDVSWAFTTTAQGNWHPFTWLSLLTDAWLWGLNNPGGFHFKNVLLHTLSTVLLFLVLARATKSVWRSAVVAALFAAHPLHVESVAWVSERKDVLAGLCFVLALAAYFRYARQPSVKRYLAVAAIFALGLLAKPMLVTLPFVLLLMDIWPLGRLGLGGPRSVVAATTGRNGARPSTAVQAGRVFLEKLPLLALSAASCIVTFLAQRAGGAVAGSEDLTFSRQAANALVSYGTYVEKTFNPAHLSFFYPYPAEIPVWQWAIAAVTLAAASLLVLLHLRHRPYLAVGWFWFIGMLVPVIGLVQVGQQAMADRYTYLPLVGLFILIVWGTADFFAARRMSALVPTTAAAAAIVGCAILACQQAGFWANSETLAHWALYNNSRNHVADDVLAYHFLLEGDNKEAAKYAEAAVAANPKYAYGWLNLATARRRLNKPEELVKAEAAARKALDLEFPRPRPATLHTYGTILLLLNRPADAEAPLREAVRLAHDMFMAHNDLAQALIAQGKAADAVAKAETACLLTNRGNPLCLGTLSTAYAASGRLDMAAATAREAAAVAGQLGDTSKAADYARRAEYYESRR